MYLHLLRRLFLPYLSVLLLRWLLLSIFSLVWLTFYGIWVRLSPRILVRLFLRFLLDGRTFCLLFILIICVFIKMNIQIVTRLNKSHLILTFVKEGKIRSNKIVNSLELLHSWQINHHCFEFCVIRDLKLSIQFLEVLFKKLLYLSPWLSVSQTLEANLLNLNLQFWRLRVAFLVESVKFRRWVLGLLDSLFHKFYSLNLAGPTHVMPYKGIDDFDGLALVLNVLL